MLKYEDYCCGCANDTYPCMGNDCPRKHVPVYICDSCGEEAVYRSGDEDFCYSCLSKYLDECFSALDVETRAYLLELDLEDCKRYYDE